MLDITAPDSVEVIIRDDGKVVWINIDGQCVFRCCQIKRLDVDDRLGKTKMKEIIAKWRAEKV